MKNVLLCLMQKYKWHITIGSGLFVLISVVVFCIRKGADIESFIAVSVAYVFFISTIWNTPFAFLPSIDESSTGAEIFSRWSIVIGAFVTLCYGLIAVSAG